MERKDISLLLVDDEKAALELLSALLAMNGVSRVRIAADADTALDLARQEKFDLIFLDVSLPKTNGFELMKLLKDCNPQSRYVMMTGYSQEEFSRQLEDNRVAAFLEKPFQIGQVLSCIDQACSGNGGAG